MRGAGRGVSRPVINAASVDGSVKDQAKLLDREGEPFVAPPNTVVDLKSFGGVALNHPSFAAKFMTALNLVM